MRNVAECQDRAFILIQENAAFCQESTYALSPFAGFLVAQGMGIVAREPAHFGGYFLSPVQPQFTHCGSELHTIFRDIRRFGVGDRAGVALNGQIGFIRMRFGKPEHKPHKTEACDEAATRAWSRASPMVADRIR